MDYKCAFNQTLIGDHFGCMQAKHVARRGGPDVACSSETAYRRCEVLFSCLKNAALPAFGVEDDLLTMPHSVLVKIQFGGLLGLQRVSKGGTNSSVTDVSTLCQDLLRQYGDVKALPYENVTADITGYQLVRRLRR